MPKFIVSPPHSSNARGTLLIMHTYIVFLIFKYVPHTSGGDGQGKREVEVADMGIGQVEGGGKEGQVEAGEMEAEEYYCGMRDWI